jgi:hypothetical protein
MNDFITFIKAILTTIISVYKMNKHIGLSHKSKVWAITESMSDTLYSVVKDTRTRRSIVIFEKKTHAESFVKQLKQLKLQTKRPPTTTLIPVAYIEFACAVNCLDIEFHDGVGNNTYINLRDNMDIDDFLFHLNNAMLYF